MKATDKGLITQLRLMLKEGIPLEDACEALELDLDAVRMYLATEGSKKVVTAEELISQFKPKAIAALAEYALNPMEDWCPAKVTACVFLAKGEGELPEFPVDKLSEMFKKMRDVVDKVEVPVNLNSSISMNNPSPATTTVEVKAGIKPIIGNNLDISELLKN